jgi:hypothetical protein
MLHISCKEAFEAYAKSHGVHMKHYHADNGRFKDNAFLERTQKNHQTISFSGVGAHHQNGIAEKRIGDLQKRATTVLLHAQRRWPDAINNHQIQNGRKARKWQDRTRIGINLGYSSRHAHSASLVLSLQTGLVSPHFHCSYDDLFQTTTGTQARSKPKSQW